MDNISVLPRVRRHVRPHLQLKPDIWEYILIGLLDSFTAVLRKANEGYSEEEYEQTRKYFFDEYSAAEHRAMAAEDRRHKEREEEQARLWHY